MLKLIDEFLNQITMYRLMLYYLIVLIFISIIFSVFGLLFFNPFSILFSVLLLIFFCGLFNKILSKIFKAPTNYESSYITALILALITKPVSNLNDILFLIAVSMIAMSSKYVLAINKKHIFNPASIALVLTTFFLSRTAIWWAGNVYLTPFILIGGLLIIRKIQRENMVYTFLFVTILISSILNIINNSNLISLYRTMFFQSSLLFFCFVMLTEPLTTPPTHVLQIIYGGLVGFLFTPLIHIANIYSTPELALVIGNIFSYFVSPKDKLFLKLKEKIQINNDIYDFVFPLTKKLSFIPGQYMEWTLPHKNPDNRGNRRYFTLASSPTESNLRIGIKFHEKSSSFKKALLNIDDRVKIAASQLAGDFVLPKENNNKYVFIAGGIGITPFRSIIKYLIDQNEKKDIILFYSNKNQSEIVYQDIFNEAEKKLGIKTFYTLTDKNNIPKSWIGKIGRINETMIREEVPDYKDRIYYLSGPHFMVTGFEDVLKNMGISRKKIKTDFFPGFV